MANRPRHPKRTTVTGLDPVAPGLERRPALHFALRFGLLLAAYYVVVLLPWGDRVLFAYLRANAWLANGLLHCLNQDTQLTDVTIRSVHFAIAVRRGCDALEPAWFFCAAVLAFPRPWRDKPSILLLGASVILALNVVRIASLFLIGRWWPQFFAPAHLELWPALFILTALAFWLRWARLTAAPGRTEPDAPA